MNLLLVDDEVIAVKGMMQGIDWRASGIDGDIVVAYNAAQARQALARQRFDLILCDIEMPGESGIELMRDVRGRFPDTACLFLTCHAKFEYAQEAIRLACEDYILMPAPYETIAAAVQKTVDSLRQQRREQEILKYGEHFLHEQEKSAGQAQGDKRTPQEIAQDTAEYIVANLANEDLSVSYLAKRSYLNEDYLNRLFKREKGMALGQFIIQERMALAARLLCVPNLSVAAIAAQVGYANYPYFVSTFKRVYACTPTQYRAQTVKQTEKSGADGV